MSSSPNSSAIEFSPRCIDATATDATYQAAKLLAADWSLTWTERIIDDSPSSMPYGHRLLQLLQLWDERFCLAFAVPDPTIGCLKSMPVESPEEVQTARKFLLAVARQVTQRLGATAPYELYLHYNPLPKPPPHWARATPEHQQSFTEGLPEEVQQCVSDGHWTRLFFVQAPAETIAKSYNYWRMQKNADPIDYDTLYQQAEQWKNVILHQPPPPVVIRSHLPAKTENTMRVSPPTLKKKRSRSSAENSTFSSSSDGTRHEDSNDSSATGLDRKRPRRENNQVEKALRFVVPQLCLAYAADTNMELSSILEDGDEDTETAESLINNILSWRRALFGDQKTQDEQQCDRRYITRDVTTWRQRVQAVLRGVELLVLGGTNAAAAAEDDESALLAHFVTACKTPPNFHTYLTERWQCKSCTGFGKLDPVAVESGFVTWQRERQEKQTDWTVKDDAEQQKRKEQSSDQSSGPKSFIEWQREKQEKQRLEKDDEPNRDATRTIHNQEAVCVASLQEQVYSLHSAVQLARERSTG